MAIIIILNNVWQQQIVKDRESGRAAVCGVTKSRTQLNDWATKKMATLFFKLQGKLVKMKLLKVTKTDSFLYMQLGKASLIKQFSWLLRKQKYA